MYKKIASILRRKENSAYIEKAINLENNTFQNNALHLRSLGLSTDDISAIAAVLEQEKDTAVLTSLSFSYNRQMGDQGATALVKSLPASLQEIGLVGCGIGDTGGRALLDWMKKAAQLHMICMEENDFSEELQKELDLFKKDYPHIMMII